MSMMVKGLTTLLTFIVFFNPNSFLIISVDLKWGNFTIKIWLMRIEKNSSKTDSIFGFHLNYLIEISYKKNARTTIYSFMLLTNRS